MNNPQLTPSKEIVSEIRISQEGYKTDINGLEERITKMEQTLASVLRKAEKISMDSSRKNKRKLDSLKEEVINVHSLKKQMEFNDKKLDWLEEGLFILENRKNIS